MSRMITRITGRQFRKLIFKYPFVSTELGLSFVAKAVIFSFFVPLIFCLGSKMTLYISNINDNLFLLVLLISQVKSFKTVLLQHSNKTDARQNQAMLLN